MQHKIIGTTMPILEFSLAAGDSIVAESGRMSWMSPDVTMATSTAATGSSGGLFGKIKRMAGGGSLFASSFTAGAAGGMVALATTVPGQIVPVSVAPDSQYMVHR